MSNLNEKACSIGCPAKETFCEMVADRPWLWTVGALVIGLFLGCGCCRKKKD